MFFLEDAQCSVLNIPALYGLFELEMRKTHRKRIENGISNITCLVAAKFSTEAIYKVLGRFINPIRATLLELL